MCGIAGSLGTKSVPVERIHSTLALMKNRGPDHSDFVQKNIGALSLSLLHCHLTSADMEGLVGHADIFPLPRIS